MGTGGEKARLVRFPAGLRAVFWPMPHFSSVAIGFWARVGGRHEPGPWCGISHFLEHLLFKGSRTRSAVAVARAIEGRGGDFNGYTQEESTCFFARVESRHEEIAFEVLADLYRNPRLAEADVRSEREVIREEIRLYEDQPAQLVEEKLQSLLWPGHPLGRPLTGTEESLNRIGRRELVAFHRRAYLPSATLVVIAGGTDPVRWCRHLEQWARGGSSRRYSLRAKPVTAHHPQERVGLIRKPVEQTHLALGFRLFGRRDRRRYALKLLSVVLGENMSSRLFRLIREEHGLAYAVQSAVVLFADTGAMTISAGTEPRHLQRVLSLALGEIRRLGKERVSDRELRRAKEYTAGQIRLGLESPSRCMQWAGECAATYGRVLDPDEEIEAFEKVTAEEICVLAREVFKLHRASLAIVGPDVDEGGRDEWVRRLAGGL